MNSPARITETINYLAIYSDGRIVISDIPPKSKNIIIQFSFFGSKTMFPGVYGKGLWKIYWEIKKDKTVIDKLKDDKAIEKFKKNIKNVLNTSKKYKDITTKLLKRDLKGWK